MQENKPPGRLLSKDMAVIRMKIKIIICALLFCCLGFAQEPLDHIIIPEGGHIEFNVTPLDDGNRTMLITISCLKSDMHLTSEIDLLPGHVYFIYIKDMGIAE